MRDTQYLVAIEHGYQSGDRHIVDYQLFKLLPKHAVRGPKPPLDPRSFFVCIGAAQTFGRFCERPFPTMLSEQLGLPVLNLGAAGAGPLFFFRRPRVVEYVNLARFAIVQVMSARSEDNSLFESRGTGGRLIRRSDGARLISNAAYEELLQKESEESVRQLVAETRSNWLRHFHQLLDKIAVPTILFWFSKRSPEYSTSYSDVKSLFGQYPQLVNASMMEELRVRVDDYVECVSSRGLPQPLFDRFSGEPTTMVDVPRELGGQEYTHNTYYPSPEMHEDAAAALLEPARRLQRSFT